MSGGTGIAGAADYHPPQTDPDPTCHVCGKVLRNASYSARCLPPLVQVCSPACAADPAYTGKKRARSRPRPPTVTPAA